MTGVTGLTDAGHQSDRCSTGNKPCKFPLCVLVSFGSEGCLFGSRSSSTPVAAGAWPTWVVSRRRVLEAVFVLLESPSPSRIIFIGSHSLPPLWFTVSVLESSYPWRNPTWRQCHPHKVTLVPLQPELPHLDLQNHHLLCTLPRVG
jgi:hypothetical protein